MWLILYSSANIDQALRAGESLVIVNRSKGEGYRRWLSSRLAQVQSFLAPYESLKSLSGNFESFLQVQDVRNVLFNLCLNSSQEIGGFEDFLEKYSVLDWNPDPLKEIRSRIGQNSFDASMSVLMEGLVTNHYSTRLGTNNVQPSPEVSDGGRCDIRVTLGDRLIFFELTGLGLGKYELGLEIVFGRLADALLDQVNGNRLVKLEIDTIRLPADKDEHLDIDASSKKLLAYAGNLRLSELFNSNVSPLSFSIDEIEKLPEKKKTIYEHEEWKLIPGSPISMLQIAGGSYLSGLISNPVFQSWSRKISPEIVLGSPIIFILMGDAKSWPLVEISDQLSFPSEASSRGGKSFLDRVKKKVKGKLESDQLQKDAPNILVIRAADWLCYGYETNRDLMPLGYSDIEKTILEALAEVRPLDLSQVRIYESDYSRAKIVDNPYVGPKAKLTTAEQSRL